MEQVPTGTDSKLAEYLQRQFRSILRRLDIIEASVVFPTKTTTMRPLLSTLQPGQCFFDTTLNKPIWANATLTHFIDATGATV